MVYHSLCGFSQLVVFLFFLQFVVSHFVVFPRRFLITAHDKKESCHGDSLLCKQVARVNEARVNWVHWTEPYYLFSRAAAMLFH